MMLIFLLFSNSLKNQSILGQCISRRGSRLLSLGIFNKHFGSDQLGLVSFILD